MKDFEQKKLSEWKGKAKELKLTAHQWAETEDFLSSVIDEAEMETVREFLAEGEKIHLSMHKFVGEECGGLGFCSWAFIVESLMELNKYKKLKGKD